jgi:hypothetical protein
MADVDVEAILYYTLMNYVILKCGTFVSIGTQFL